MPSRAVYESLIGQGFNIGRNRYDRFDSLETNEDLEILFETLLELRDVHGNHPIITANNIVGNPDFEKIESSGFMNYYYEPFTRTYDRYPGSDKVMALFVKGIKEGVIKPQYHSRDHINVKSWLSALSGGDRIVQEAFKNRMVSFDTITGADPRLMYSDALNYKSIDEEIEIQSSIIEGARLFKDVWGFESKSFIAPCYIWDPGIEKALSGEGVLFLQGLFVQYVPSPRSLRLNKKYHYSGQKNDFGQHYLVRNAMFEPSEKKYTDPVGNCLKEISIAFRFKKPAIICSHRVNYIGAIDPGNRTKNNILLKQLLGKILGKWPDVEFMSSDKLGRILSSS
jgi:hypothetical protein